MSFVPQAFGEAAHRATRAEAVASRIKLRICSGDAPTSALRPLTKIVGVPRTPFSVPNATSRATLAAVFLSAIQLENLLLSIFWKRAACSISL